MKKITLLFFASILIVLSRPSLSAQIQLGADINGENAHDLFGEAIALSADGTRMAVSALGYDGDEEDIGYVQIYEWMNEEWVQLGNSIEGEIPNGFFGRKIALSGNGNRIVISGSTTKLYDIPVFGSGFVKIYEFNNGEWIQVGNTLFSNIDNDNFGASVTISFDGNRIAVGAPGFYNDAFYAGRVKIFGLANGHWGELGEDILGTNIKEMTGQYVSMSADGTRLAVGAPFNSNGGTQVGNVRVFHWINKSWEQLGNTMNGRLYYRQFQSLALSGNGERVAFATTIAGGDPVNGFTHYSLTATFEWDGNLWKSTGRVGTYLGDINPTHPPGIGGVAIALNYDGGLLGVYDAGGSGENKGRASFYKWTGEWWHRMGEYVGNEAPNDYTADSQIALSADGTQVVIGAGKNNGNGEDAGRARAYYLEKHLVRGRVYEDENLNCMPDIDEPVISKLPVVFEKNNEFQWATMSYATGQIGREGWIIKIDTGLYNVGLNLNNYPYHAACPTSQEVEVDGSSVYTPIDIMVQKNIDCPYLITEVHSSTITRCEEGACRLVVRNNGTEDATDVVLKVDLDEHLIFTGSLYGPPTFQNDNILTFQIDTLKAHSSWASFFFLTENCESEPGQVHCISAYISPDSLCLPSLPNIAIETTCENDSIHYQVTNLAAGFPAPLPYLILNNTSEVANGTVFLANGETTRISYFIDGSTDMFQLVIAPDDEFYYYGTPLKGCEEGVFSTNIQYPVESPQAYESSICLYNVEGLLGGEVYLTESNTDRYDKMYKAKQNPTDLPFAVYPNPNNGEFQIDLNTFYEEVQVTLRNLLGQTIGAKNYKNVQHIPFQIEESSGVYFLEIDTNQGTRKVLRVIKK